MLSDINECIRKLQVLTDEREIVWEVTNTDPHIISTKINGDTLTLDDKGLSLSFSSYIFDATPFMKLFVTSIVRTKVDRRYYNKYIRELTQNKTPTDLINRCKEYSIRMVRDFPELRLVGGYYVCSKLGKRVHWWCESPNGAIIDSTAAQFPSRGTGSYREVLPRERENGRKCKSCLSPLYDNELDFCTTECENKDIRYKEYLSGRNK